MGYKAKLQMKILRTEHEVTVRQLSRAKSLKEDLAHVPDYAEVINIDCDDGVLILTFREEVENEP